jgi:hypothetical protein
MSRKEFTFDPTLLDRAGVDAFKKLDAPVQRRSPLTFVARVRHVATAVLLITLPVGAVVLVGLLIYVPGLWPAIEQLLWK